MNRPLFALCLSLICACFAARAESKMLVGVRVGPILADIRGPLNDDAPYKPKLGLIAGGSIEWLPHYEAGHWNSGVRLELLYVQKGWMDQVQHTDEDAHFLGWITTGTVHIDELVWSVLYTLRMPAGRVTPFLQFGPEAGFNLRADEKLSGELGGGTWEYPYSWKRRANWSLNMGAGVALPVKAGELSCDARYNLGLTNMAGSRYVTPIKTDGMQLLLGYSFQVM